jgi:N-acyl-D-amino-acid deacylase
VRRQTHDTARAVDLHDRGVLEPGMKGDVNVIDFEHLRIWAPEIVHDLPAGGARLEQKAEGFLATWSAARSPTNAAGRPTPCPGG